MLGRRFSLLTFASLVCCAMFVVASCATGTGVPGFGGDDGGASEAGTVGPACIAGQTACGTACVVVTTDNQNCGACGTICATGTTCLSGACACAPGLVSCGGACVASDIMHCGSTCTVCPTTGVCSADLCAAMCPAGSTECSDGACSSTTDSAHCGSACTACTGGSTCSNGACACATAGQMLCGTPASCIDTTSNAAHCGSCSLACGTNQACTNSVCVTTVTGGTDGGGSGTDGAVAGGEAGAGSEASTTTGEAGARACAPASVNVISDFEDKTGDVIPQSGRDGWWYVFGDTASAAGMQTPAASATGPIAVASVTAPLPASDTAMCDLYAMHSTASGHGILPADYVGFGTSVAQIMPPPAAGAKTKDPINVSTFNGVSFNIKVGSGTAPPVWFELLNTQTEPAPDGVATNNAVDEYNTRGKLLSNLTTSWTTVYVPFGTLAPRYLPASTSTGCTTPSVLCQAPAWDPTSLLGLQFSVYPQFSTASLNYDLWVDDVTLYTGTNGLATMTPTGATPAHPFPVDGALGSCSKPAGATGAFLVDAYNQWKSTFVVASGNTIRIQRPENADDTVSEGIGYGMLIAVYMGDQTLFNGLWAYSQTHTAGGMLMTWCIPGGGGGIGASCSGSGSATDADEDMAFALLKADKQWGSTGTYNYKTLATTMIGQIWSGDIDASTMLPKGGNSYGSASPTNPSYFAPAYYREFAKVDSNAWTTVVANVYAAIGRVESSAGLIPAWCVTSGGTACGAPGMNTAPDDTVFQYDAHRVAWRLGIDACWNGVTTGSTYLTANAKFFATASANGIGRVSDIYMLSGTPNADAKPNSMSAIGTAGVGAMAVGNAFASTSYRFLLDATYTPDPATRTAAYTYYNATVGLLSALTMSGNFNNF